VTIHSSSDTLSPSERCIVGSATFTIVLSSMIMKRPNATATSVHHFLFSSAKSLALMSSPSLLALTKLVRPSLPPANLGVKPLRLRDHCEGVCPPYARGDASPRDPCLRGGGGARRRRPLDRQPVSGRARRGDLPARDGGVLPLAQRS